MLTFPLSILVHNSPRPARFLARFPLHDGFVSSLPPVNEQFFPSLQPAYLVMRRTSQSILWMLLLIAATIFAFAVFGLHVFNGVLDNKVLCMQELAMARVVRCVRARAGMC